MGLHLVLARYLSVRCSLQLDSLRVSRKHAIAGAVHSAKTYSRDNSVVHQRQPKSQMEVVFKSRKPFFGVVTT